MRGKAKYLAIIAVLCVVVLAAVLVGCAAKPLDVLANTTDWLASAENAKVEDTIEIKNLEIDIPKASLGYGVDLLKIDSLKIKSTREIKGDAMKLTLEILEIKGATLNKELDGAISSFVKGLKISGLDEVTMNLVVNYDLSQDNALTLEFHGFNLDKFMTDLPSGDSNSGDAVEVLAKKTDISGDKHAREEEIIGSIMDLLDNPIYGAATSIDAAKGDFIKLKPNFANIQSVIDTALKLYGKDKIADTQLTANGLIAKVFGTDGIGKILSNVFKFPTFALTDVETAKVDGKEVLAKSKIATSNTKVVINETYMAGITSNIGDILGAFGVDISAFESLIGLVLKGDATLAIGSVTINSVYTNVK